MNLFAADPGLNFILFYPLETANHRTASHVRCSTPPGLEPFLDKVSS